MTNEEKTPGKINVDDDIVDGGRVIIMLGIDSDEGPKMVPIPLPALMQQLMAVIGKLEARIKELESPGSGKSLIVNPYSN